MILTTLLLVNFAATCFMCGVIWFVQIVHYPLFCQVGGNFADYHRAHLRRITPLVASVMLIECASAVGLVILQPRQILAWVALMLLVLIWLSTFLIQIPQHNALGRAYAHTSHRALCRWNWPRTVLWTARGVVVGLWLFIV